SRHGWSKEQVMQRPSIRGPVALLALSLSLGACRGEPTPPLFTGDLARPAEEASSDSPAPVAAPERNLWFASGPGRDAILARERQDFAAAAKLLDDLLKNPKLGPDDRGAA